VLASSLLRGCVEWSKVYAQPTFKLFKATFQRAADAFFCHVVKLNHVFRKARFPWFQSTKFMALRCGMPLRTLRALSIIIKFTLYVL
jgi:hypothetical protein